MVEAVARPVEHDVVADEVRRLEPENFAVESAGGVEIRGLPTAVQKLLDVDAGVGGCHAPLVHPGVELDVGAAGVGEPQPVLDAVLVRTTALRVFNTPLVKPGPYRGEAGLAGDLVANSLDAFAVSLLET